MTKDQVIQVMGSESASLPGDDTFSNPYKKEILRVAADIYEVLYYYTDQMGQRSWETGVTPVVFKDSKLVGMGWAFLEQSNLKASITVHSR